MLSALALASALSLAATETHRVAAADADQGVASDGRYLYAIDNHTIARIDPKDGKIVARWDGDPAKFKHINSCTVDGKILVCAASNYPNVPMESMIETFDKGSLTHLSTRQLGHGAGSLTWTMRHDGAWYAGFANYDGRGGEPGRDHRFTALVRYDGQWQETARWTFPDSVLERMAPKSASGGVWGDDGLLYVTGHDRPELYALRVPPAGGVLEHVATIALPTDGQAISWDGKDKRLLWSIERKTHEMVASRVPEVLTK
jgi:outer membrane protein assembly factor BamB